MLQIGFALALFKIKGNLCIIILNNEYCNSMHLEDNPLQKMSISKKQITSDEII